MKLILKRCGDDPRLIRGLGDYRPPELIPDHRPFALHTEDGEVLPGQATTSLTSAPGGMTTLTVTFNVDGNNVIIQGDRRGAFVPAQKGLSGAE